jgi:hypothetical protein
MTRTGESHLSFGTGGKVLTDLGAKSAAGVAVAATVAVPVTTDTARSVEPVSSYRGSSPAGRLEAG